MNPAHSPAGTDHGTPWPDQVHDRLRSAGVRHVSYVPDAGHARLIERFHDDDDTTTTVLTSEEEGVAVAVGSWLGGVRSVVLLQSSGVGNCINMLSLPVQARCPLLMLVTMRGEWAEFNPSQVPMSKATRPALEAIGVTVLRADAEHDAAETVRAAAAMAYDGDQQVAVLFGQRLIGDKKW